MKVGKHHRQRTPEEKAVQLQEQLIGRSRQQNPLSNDLPQHEVEDRVQPHPNRSDVDWSELDCVRFLKLHRHYGGVDKKGYDILFRMIQMITGIAWEAHLGWETDDERLASARMIQRYVACILQGCDVFSKNMKGWAEKAVVAVKSLPKLKDPNCSIERKMELWREKLAALHEPTGNDVKLFQCIFQLFANIYQHLMYRHGKFQGHVLPSMCKSAREVYDALILLPRLAEHADELVFELDRRYKKFVDAAACREGAAPKVDDLCVQEHAVLKQPSSRFRPTPHNQHSKSFAAAEDAIARRAQASTWSEADYATAGRGRSTESNRQMYATAFKGPPIGKRRKGVSIPRIFTGSFSELESDIHKLRLHRIKTPEAPVETASSDPIKIRDFGNTPAVSPRPLLSPLVPLTHDRVVPSDSTETCQRLMIDPTMHLHSPPIKARAQTIGGISGGLDAWLREDSSNGHVTSPSGSVVRRSSLKHRENTL